MQAVALAEVKRGGFVESVHMGCVAVADARGELLYCAGDPHFWTFTRSTLKPFQAIPFVHAGGAEYFGFSSRELALMCASHSGEPVHTERVQFMLHQAGCSEQDLQCGCHVPIAYSAAGGQVLPGQSFSQLHNNCSGKHAGFLAYCRQHGMDLRTYLDSVHPLQGAVRGSVAHFSGVLPESLKMGIDGCSAPNYAVPLSRLALAYARFAQDAADPHYGDAPYILFNAMAAHPELVSGSGRTDLAISRAGHGDWVAKAGAEGVQAIGIRPASLGIAIKILDGDARALAVITIEVLRQLDLLSAGHGMALRELAHPALLNCKGQTVGEICPVFKLQRSAEHLVRQ
jgi:L-asparaginase II